MLGCLALAQHKPILCFVAECSQQHPKTCQTMKVNLFAASAVSADRRTELRSRHCITELGLQRTFLFFDTLTICELFTSQPSDSGINTKKIRPVYWFK